MFGDPLELLLGLLNRAEVNSRWYIQGF